jgi:transcriptional regulator with XRE-family HTH domain
MGMKLETYLTQNQIKPSSFAAEIGVAPSTITRLLKGERSPRLDLIMLIKEKTGGLVTAEDFHEPLTPERFDHMMTSMGVRVTDGAA